MAQPLAFPEANVIYYPPAGMEDDVLPLHVRRGDGCLISCWKLTAEEVAEILRTGVVWLSVLGRGLPPVMISGRRSDMI